MGFNGKSLILVGVILFIFQIANFISIDSITPELERAQVLAAIASLIIILVGFLFKQFEPLAGEKAAFSPASGSNCLNKKPIKIIINEAIAANTCALSSSGVIVSI